jgi:uncharacterized membrane protein
MTETLRGVLLALIAGVVWGLAPLYFRWVGAAPPLEIVLHRVLWSVPMMAIALTVMRRWAEVAPVLLDWRRLRVLVVTAALITTNWFVFVYAVSTAQVVEASLGYFINPLFSAALGVFVLGERPRPLGWCAFVIAAAGVGNELVQFGSLPWRSGGRSFGRAARNKWLCWHACRPKRWCCCCCGAGARVVVRTGQSHFGEDVELSLFGTGRPHSDCAADGFSARRCGCAHDIEFFSVSVAVDSPARYGSC